MPFIIFQFLQIFLDLLFKKYIIITSQLKAVFYTGLYNWLAGQSVNRLFNRSIGQSVKPLRLSCYNKKQERKQDKNNKIKIKVKI